MTDFCFTPFELVVFICFNVAVTMIVGGWVVQKYLDRLNTKLQELIELNNNKDDND